MKRLKYIGVKSVFRVSLILGAAAGLLVGVVLSILSMIEGRFLEGGLILVLAPLLYGLLGAIVNSIMAWFYNFFAERLGGIEIDLE